MDSTKPSTFWPNAVLGTSAAAGVAATTYCVVDSKEKSWTGLVLSLLWTGTSLFGLYALRKWTASDRSKETVPSASLLKLILDLNTKVDGLYIEYCKEEHQKIPEDLQKPQGSAPAHELQLQQMLAKIDCLRSIFEEDSEKVDELQKDLDRLRANLEKDIEPQKRSHAPTPSTAWGNLDDLQKRIKSLGLGSPGSPAAKGGEATPLPVKRRHTLANQRLFTNGTTKGVAEEDSDD